MDFQQLRPKIQQTKMLVKCQKLGIQAHFQESNFQSVFYSSPQELETKSFFSYDDEQNRSADFSLFSKQVHISGHCGHFILSKFG